MTDNAHYLFKAAGALKGACGAFDQGAEVLAKGADSLRRAAMGGLSAARGHLETAKQFQDTADQLQGNLVAAQDLLGSGIDPAEVISALGDYATQLLDGVVTELSGLIPPLEPLVFDPPALLDVTDFEALKNHIVDEASAYMPPEPDGILPMANALMPDSILSSPPVPTPAMVSSALGVVNFTGLDFLEGVYPTGEISRPSRPQESA